MNKLSFETLREANILRLPQFKNKYGQPAHSQPDRSDWSISDWIECVTGELGELANLHKKLRRGDITQEQFDKEGAKEVADIQIYLDILAFQMKLDLGQTIEDKFNEVSDRVKSNIFIVNNKVSTEKLLDIIDVKPQIFENELKALINKYSRENFSNTPDFILAGFMLYCLQAFESSVNRRTKHFAAIDKIDSHPNPMAYTRR